MIWTRVNKGDVRCREMADRHYTRQSPGHPMWTRPGYNFVLYASDDRGQAVFCWWRPKWEAGQERKDLLRTIECTMFRNENMRVLSSTLIKLAVFALTTPDAVRDLKLDSAGKITSGLITGVSSRFTARRRGRLSKPGKCFYEAGWQQFFKRGGRADIWLTTSMPRAQPEERV